MNRSINVVLFGLWYTTFDLLQFQSTELKRKLKLEGLVGIASSEVDDLTARRQHQMRQEDAADVPVALPASANDHRDLAACHDAEGVEAANGRV